MVVWVCFLLGSFIIEIVYSIYSIKLFKRYTELLITFLELRPLAELIGAYGIKFLCERLIWQVASQISELKVIIETYSRIGSFRIEER